MKLSILLLGTNGNKVDLEGIRCLQESSKKKGRSVR